MICHNCGQDSAYIDETSETYGEGDKLVVIEHIPVINCRNCSEEFFTAETTHALDELIDYLQLNPAARVYEQPVRVASFQGNPAATQVYNHPVTADSGGR